MVLLIRFVSVLLLTAGLASAAKLRPPSGFKAKALGVNSFLLEWKDNSDNEDGFQVFATLGSGEPEPYQTIPADQTSFVLRTNNIPGKTVRLQLASYQGAGSDRKFSKPTPVVEAKAAERAVFEAPRNLRAAPIDDSSIRLTWKDLSTSESGYLIEFRRDDGDWQLLGDTPVQNRYNLTISALLPETRYSFRVTAYDGVPGSLGGAVFSDPSNVATATTPAFLAPTRLRVKSDGEGSVSLRWKDNSSIEEGYEVQVKIGKRKFRTVGTLPPNTEATPSVDLELDARLKIRIRAVRTVNGKLRYSDFSKVVSKRSLGLARPTDLRITGSTEDSVTLAWNDESGKEEGYTVRFQQVGKKTASVVNLPADTESHTLTGLKVGKDYRFQVRAFEGKTVSRYSAITRGGTRDQFKGLADFSLETGISFFEKVRFTRPSRLVKIAVTGLPPGLSFDEDDLSLFGVPTQAGEFRATVRARFQGYWLKREFTFRVVAREEVPEIVSPLADLAVAAGGAKVVDLAGSFRDPDVTTARRFVTNLGTFDVVLYDEATPLTVANFLRYADGGLYADTFFHRAPTGFVVQGGGFTYDGSSFGRVETFDPVKNEPGISNLTGTVAMAKVGGDPDSATSQFFINLSDDNAPNLDAQNGGFTVFGRIAGDGMDLFDEIDALPKGTYSINVGQGPVSFGDVPVQADFPAPAELDPGQLIRVTSVAPAPILRYSVSSSDAGVATAVVDGEKVTIGAVSPGTARIQVRATDLDGAFIDQVFSVTVD